MVEAERDLAEALVTAKRKFYTCVPESVFNQACLAFDQKYVEMRVNEAALIEKRRPQKTYQFLSPCFRNLTNAINSTYYQAFTMRNV